MSDRWFYTTGGQSRGALTAEQLRQLIASGAVPPQILVWTEGMSTWAPAVNVSGLLTPAAPPPPATESYIPAARAQTRVYSQVHPWVRFWARVVDLGIAQLILGFAIGMMIPGVALVPSLMLGIVILFLWMLIEAALLSSWGTTPGKWLLAVQVTRRDGRRLDFSQALSRTFALWLRGLGLGLPVVVLVTMGIGWANLTRDGVTSWDRECGTSVSHGEFGPGRVLAVCLIVLAVALLTLAGMGMAVWA